MNTKPQHDLAANRTLDEINAELCTEEQVGEYYIHFTGLIPSQDTTTLVGTWLAWPVRLLASDGTRVAGARHVCPQLPYLVCNVRGSSCGSYEPGGCWDVRPPAGQVPITKALVQTVEGMAEVRAAVAEGKQRLLALVEAAVAGRTVPRCPRIEYWVKNLDTGEFVPRATP